MPTYEFRCPQGHEFTRFYKTISGAASELPCPDCDAVATRQLSGGAGLLFKGSGFYLTDYGKNAHRKPEAVESKADGGGRKAEGGERKAEGGERKAEGGASADAKPAESKAESPKPKADGASAEKAKPKAGGPSSKPK